MTKRRMGMIGAAALVLAGVTGGGVAWATAGDDAGERVTGAAADRAGAAALARVGAGTVEGVERGDDAEAAWEVEITRADGSTVEVRLDAGYRVLGAAPDDAETGGDGAETGGDGAEGGGS